MLYLTSDQLPVFIPLGLIGCYRYLWYIIRILASICYQPIPIPDDPTYLAEEDVTIIVPTIDADDSFADAARSWLANNPREIIIVTETSVATALEKLAIENPKKGRIRVITVPKANKRLQMSAGIRETKTDIIVFADDDALWPKTLLRSVLGCFEDQSIGGVGTSQVVKPCDPTGKLTVWETLAAFRLTIRNIEISASTHIDGGIPCLSGRTAAYRTMILKDSEFLHGFTHDFWRGKYQLNSGDDKFLTRWMVSHGWKTYAQCTPEAELQSTMKPDWRFLKQVLRWTRNTWRSDLRSMFIERHIWRAHPYVAFTMVDKVINPFTLLAGPCLVFYLMIRSSEGNAPNGFHLPAWNIIFSYLAWLLITRTLKLLPHLYKRPQDIIYIPVWLLFGYYFAIMKLYALMTLHVTGWGTREGIDDPTEATNAAEMQQKEKENSNRLPSSSEANLTGIENEEIIKYNHHLEENQRDYHPDEKLQEDVGFRRDEDGEGERSEHFKINSTQTNQTIYHSQSPILKSISSHQTPLYNPFSPPQSNDQLKTMNPMEIKSESNPSSDRFSSPLHPHHQPDFLKPDPSNLTHEPVVEISITSPDLRRRRYYY
ncbi:family 2 glycosyltransferase [Melampsora americana]|nr:family 2 glycosyltransferase [Melampsora americana]